MTVLANRTVLVGAGIGAGLMFLLDPARGNRRRALIRDKMVLAARKTRDAAGATRRDLGNRLYGMTSRVGERFSDAAADDRVVCERVRSELGRVTSHPRAICVEAVDGTVNLSGDILASEAPAVLSAARGVRGVREVHDRLALHASAEGVPALQGGVARPGQWMTWLRSGWSPAALLACAGSAAATLALLAPRAAAAIRARA